MAILINKENEEILLSGDIVCIGGKYNVGKPYKMKTKEGKLLSAKCNSWFCSGNNIKSTFTLIND